MNSVTFPASEAFIIIMFINWKYFPLIDIIVPVYVKSSVTCH